jgi:hypothetical protein
MADNNESTNAEKINQLASQMSFVTNALKQMIEANNNKRPAETEIPKGFCLFILLFLTDVLRLVTKKNSAAYRNIAANFERSGRYDLKTHGMACNAAKLVLGRQISGLWESIISPTSGKYLYFRVHILICIILSGKAVH